jgi:hypothetical protein
MASVDGIVVVDAALIDNDDARTRTGLAEDIIPPNGFKMERILIDMLSK